LTEVPERVAPAPGRSRACADQTHQACGHVIAAIAGARPRREATILLCSCACHEACQLARRKLDGVPVRVWRQRCRCPGAEQARTTQGDLCELLPGFDEFRESFEREARQRSEARKDALLAARTAAPGKTRDEIRELFAAELRARGLKVPPDRLLEVAVDMITGEPRTGLGKLRKAVLRTFTDE
jgi:hypothetical protein